MENKGENLPPLWRDDDTMDEYVLTLYKWLREVEKEPATVAETRTYAIVCSHPKAIEMRKAASGLLLKIISAAIDKGEKEIDGENQIPVWLRHDTFSG